MSAGADAPEISDMVAREVLWYFGDFGLGWQPGSFIESLLKAFGRADSTNFAKLSGAFPDYGYAFGVITHTSWGLDWLRKRVLDSIPAVHA